MVRKWTTLFNFKRKQGEAINGDSKKKNHIHKPSKFIVIQEQIFPPSTCSFLHLSLSLHRFRTQRNVEWERWWDSRCVFKVWFVLLMVVYGGISRDRHHFFPFALIEIHSRKVRKRREEGKGTKSRERNKRLFNTLQVKEMFSPFLLFPDFRVIFFRKPEACFEQHDKIVFSFHGITRCWNRLLMKGDLIIDHHQLVSLLRLSLLVFSLYFLVKCSLTILFYTLIAATRCKF